MAIAFCMPSVQQPKQFSGDIAQALLAHYDRHARPLPWRSPPGTPPPDPYRVWLSEVMLQQTTVAAVIPYFEKFVARWPDFSALESAPDADVMAAWAGLGYYSRARNLLKCAQAVVSEHGGRLPNTATELTKLPGIGPYTGAAIAAIAFGERVAVVDANVERVASRLFAIETPLPEGKPAIREAVDAITPAKRPGDFAQAMMDLGAGICSVRNPQCLICPLRTHCRTRAMNIAESLPRKAAKKAKPERSGTAYWIERDDYVWLVRRPPHGMLGGMRALPDDGWSARANGDSRPPINAKWHRVDGSVAHVFTHFRLTLGIAVTSSPVHADTLTAIGHGGEWWPVKSLDSAGLPTLFVKAARLAQRASAKVPED
jgi:A/G-specific adenine glycosylase